MKDPVGDPVAPALTHQSSGSMMRIYPVLVIRMLRSISLHVSLDERKVPIFVRQGIYSRASLKQLGNWTIGHTF